MFRASPNVGSVHADAARDVKFTLDSRPTIDTKVSDLDSAATILYPDGSLPPRYTLGNVITIIQKVNGTTRVVPRQDYTSSAINPTSSVNKPRAFGCLPCVYLGA